MQTLLLNPLGIKLFGRRSLRFSALKKTLNHYHLLCFVGSFIALQFAYFCGLSLQRDFNVERSILTVENRVSLDLPRLSLPNPALNLAGNPAQVQEYLQKLNGLLVEQHLPVRVSSLQQFDTEFDNTGEQHAHQLVERKLQLPGQIISLKLSTCQPTFAQSISPYPLFAALLLVFLLSPYLKRKPAPVVANLALSQRLQLGLILDLENKCIAVRGTNSKVELANKPLCFYAALLNYCQQHPQARLCQHTSLPDELLQLSNRYFLRLVALGHTIRKRPDFDANLEKMLSEIRAALDELFLHHPESKTLFYPPKAAGEGSRSKMHNFALAKLDASEWEIKGK